MLEGIIPGVGLGMNKIERLHRREPSLDIATTVHYGGQKPRIEAPADDRCRLKQSAVLQREPINARCEQALDARRQRRCDRISLKFHSSRIGAQQTALDKEAHDLFGEESVTFRPFYQLPRQSLGQSLSA